MCAAKTRSWCSSRGSMSGNGSSLIVDSMKQKLADLSGCGHLVVCEGVTDLHLIRQFAGSLGPSRPVICGYPEGSWSNLSSLLRGLSRNRAFSEVSSLALIADDDGDAASRLRECHAALVESNLPTPPNRTWLDCEGMRIGIFLVPTCLEHLLLQQLDSDAVQCARVLLECANWSGNQSQMAKALFLASMAALHGESTTVGAAINRGLVSVDHESLAPIRQFLMTGWSREPQVGSGV